MKKSYMIIAIAVAGFLTIAISYVAWNRMDPDFTCALCHEIRPSCVSWKNSVHADISCTQCHGTALLTRLHNTDIFTIFVHGKNRFT